MAYAAFNPIISIEAITRSVVDKRDMTRWLKHTAAIMVNMAKLDIPVI